MLSASSLLFGLEAPACGGQVFQPEGSSMVGVASVIGVPTAGKPAADDIWLAGVIDRERRINALIHVNSHDTTSATKTIIEAAEVDSADTELAKSGGAHDAGLDGHVEVGVVQDVGVVAGHDLG
jgi:hypothetical protein